MDEQRASDRGRARVFLARDDGAIVSLSRDGGEPAEVLPARAQKKVVALVAKRGWVYVAFADAIMRVPR